jgi:hypothetical protein
MPTYLTGNPPDYPELAMLEFFSGLDQDGYKSGTQNIGQLKSMADVDDIVPKPDYRVELEYTEGEEEIRVVNNSTGEYHSATGEMAKAILKDMKARQEVDLKEDGNYPGGHRRNDPTDTIFIQYDNEGHRIWPSLRRAGICETRGEFLSHDGGYVFWDEWMEGHDTCEDYFAITDSRTGDYWISGPEATREMREEEGS